MNEKMSKIFLPAFYTFIIICIVGVVITVHNMNVEQKNRLLTIKNNLNIGEIGQSVKLELTEHNRNEEITYHIQDENIVKVTEDGNIISVGEGSTKVTVTNKDNSKTQTFIVNVGEEAAKEYEENKNNSNQTIPNDIQEDVLVNGLSLNQTQVSLYVGDNLTLLATINPTNATNKNLIWTTSNSKVVTVSNGTIKAIGEGNATITVKSSNNKSATCEIVVKKINSNIDATKIYLNKTTLNMMVGDSDRVIATISPNNVTDKNIYYQSSNTKIVTVDPQGNIKATGVGTATISAKASNGIYATCKVIVSAKTVEVKNIVLDKNSATLSIGDNTTLTVTVSPSNATNKNITWTSSNTNVATVNNNGVVTAKKVGTATITATSSNGKKVTCAIKVTDKKISVTGIKINKSFASLSVGGTVILSATISPNNATNKNITWTSSNENVATVNSTGVVTAKAGGTAIITASSNNGIKTTTTISVKYKAASLNEMKSSYSLIVSKAGNGYYAYAPSIMIKNGNTYIWSCQNKIAHKTYDHIYLNTNNSSRNLILSPGTGWDSYHVCDPSVVEGNFTYNNVIYKYAMAYLGINNGSCLGNDIGLAVSNSLDSGWIKVGSSSLVSYDGNDRWGVGQPSLIYVGGKLILFYTNDTGLGSGMQVRIINPKTMKIESSSNLSTTNTTWMHNADFTYKNNRLYVAYEGNEAPTTGDIISNTIQIKSAYINDFTKISSYSNLSWETENVISSSVSGKVRNTNAGLFRNPNGELHSRYVAFTATTYGSGDGHYTYNIYKSKF